MFDYMPEYAKNLRDEISKIEDEEIKSHALAATDYHIFSDIADEYNRRYSNEETAKKYEDFCKKHDYIKTDTAKIIRILGSDVVGYVLDVIYDIVEAIDDFAYDRGFDDGFEQCEKEDIDFVVDTPKEYLDSCHYKPVCKKRRC